ncbi:MAG: L-seryl-tRNA(Sec) selenium transferase [Planctomycetes bacterium]|nr:L-seryl-tRNA(Sec) selenium transferase [Planctomycetota bacterium]
MARPPTDRESAFRLLPAMDELLRAPRAAALCARAPRALVQELAAAELAAWRDDIKAGRLDAAELEARLAAGELFTRLEQRLARELGRGVVRAVNASGVVLNTGLGRAPVHPEAAEAMRVAAESYCVLEVDRWSGERNQRDDYLSDLLRRLTGAEAGIGVNNNAGAVLLLFSTFAQGRSAIVSRGELVEIGGSFRVPNVMERAGAELVEVGTTNRTRLADYASAIDARTGLLIKVHTSNFRVVGFTEEATADELARLGRERGVTSAYDLGSGLWEGDGAPALAPLLGGEPLLLDAVKSGVDVVTFSGDKLLGGPQAGLLVGRRATIAALRKNPLYRALRLDKVALAGLEKTLELLLAGRGAELPARAMLAATANELRPRAEELQRALSALPGLALELVSEGSQPGSGSAPGVLLPTWAVRVRPARGSAGALAARLRAAPVPVFTRVQDDAVLLDPRTLLPGDLERLVDAFRGALAGS